MEKTTTGGLVMPEVLETHEGSSGLSEAALGQLSHMIYDVALDNSRWAEMVAQVETLLESAPTDGVAGPEGLDGLRQHVERAMEISDRLSAARDANDLGARLLSSLALSFELFDSEGRVIPANEGDVPGTLGAGGRSLSPPVLPQALRLQARSERRPLHLAEEAEPGTDVILLGPNHVRHLGLPPRVHWARLRLARDPGRIAASLGATHGLTAGRSKLLAAFLEHADLRQAAAATGLSYESARTYLKDICHTLGLSGQTELMRAALQSPLSVLDADLAEVGPASVRRQIERPEGGQIEYFSLGDEEGYPILHFDAMSGVGLDVLRFPSVFEAVLRDLGARLIVPCRPGTFRSTFVKRASAAGDAEDVRLLCDTLEIDRFAVLCNSFGSVTGLHVAHALGERCERVVLASVHNPDRSGPRRPAGSYLEKISTVIGRRSPVVLRWLIPFLCKSVIQDPGKFAEKAISVADCAHEEAILRSPNLLTSVQMMLEERTASGFAGVIQEHRHIGRNLGFPLSDLQMPLLLFHGECDRSNPLEGARALAEAAPNARLHVLEGMGRSMIKAEWDWLLAAACGRPVEIPAAERRGPLVEILSA